MGRCFFVVLSFKERVIKERRRRIGGGSGLGGGGACGRGRQAEAVVVVEDAMAVEDRGGPAHICTAD